MANGTGSNPGFEERLWTAADKLRGTMDASRGKYGYPPDLAKSATDLVPEQTEVLCNKWV